MKPFKSKNRDKIDLGARKQILKKGSPIQPIWAEEDDEAYANNEEDGDEDMGSDSAR